MSDHRIPFVIAYTTAWLVFAWGTFAIVTLRNRVRAKRDLTTSRDTLPQLCSSDPRPRANATEGLDSPTDLPAKSEQKESRDDE